TYRHIPGKTSSLASDDVSSVLADSKGRLWAGGEGSGVNLYEPATDSFRHFRHQPDRADSLSGNDVMVMAEGSKGTLWVGTYGHGLDHMTSPGHFQHFVHDPGNPHSLISNNIFSLFNQGDGKLWIGTDRGLEIREPDGHLRQIRFEGVDRAPAVWGIDGSSHRMRVATTNGLFMVGADGVARRAQLGRFSRFAILSSVLDRHGNLWIATVNGLLLVRHGRITYFPPRPLLPGGQPGQAIFNLFLDNEGGLWIATKNSGVAYLSPDWNNFSHYSHRPDDAGSLSSSQIHALTPDGHGNLWIGGGMNQLDKLNPTTGAVVHYGKVLGTKPQFVFALAPAGKNSLWLGFSNAIALLEHNHLRQIQTPGFGGVRSIVSDASGALYAASVSKGVIRVNRQTLKIEWLKLAFAGGPDRQTTRMLMHDGQLWRASHAGLSYLPAHSSQFVPVAGVAKGNVSAMTISGKDLWLVRSDGLEHYRLHDRRAALVKRIDAAAGWPGIVANTMLVDKRGRVWLFGNVGLWRYDPSTNRFRHYGQEDGLPSPEFISQQLAHLDNGAVFAGTLGGVVGFRPDAIVDHPRKPQLVITSIVVRRDGKNIALPPGSRDLHLDWNDRDLRITAHAMSYIDPSRNHYRFRLVGLDNGWVDTGTRGMRELAGLKAGHYQLKVQAAGPSGVWASLATPITIGVDAPPWLRPWAWLLYALVVLAAGYGIIAAWRRRLEQRHHVQLAHQQQRMAEQANAAKTRFLATLSHEIRTPMTGVLGMTELLLGADLGTRERGHVETIRRSGKMLLKLVNEALDMARIEAGRLVLEPAPMDLRALIEEVRQLQASQTHKKNLDFLAQVDASVPVRLEGDATRIKQILLNLTNNAIKFTPHGHVTITASYADGELRLCVSDTGPGISETDRQRLFQRFEQADSPQRREGSGLGLAICRELVALMHGRMDLETTLGKGSCFKVFLPLPVATVEVPETAPDAPDRSIDGDARHLLLIEDNATVAQVICGLLEARGHRVTHAAHGLDALSEMQNRHFDALLLDMNLPGVDGCELARMIRQLEGDDVHMPIIAITARSGGDEEQQARAAGMDAFLRKPIDGEELARTLNRLCQTRQASPA
ncbi:MAG TPA: ATP-binding protein, partial [Rhodanobacteraceae bacterium]|nr:ATP-binding protein [Rhodanobacteraceae bacterium]